MMYCICMTGICPYLVLAWSCTVSRKLVEICSENVDLVQFEQNSTAVSRFNRHSTWFLEEVNTLKLFMHGCKQDTFLAFMRLTTNWGVPYLRTEKIVRRWKKYWQYWAQCTATRPRNYWKAMGLVETHGLSNKSAKCRRVAESVGSHRGYTTFDSNAIQKYSEPFQNNRSFDPQDSQILLLQVKEIYHIFFTVIQSISVSDSTLADLDGFGLDFQFWCSPSLA